MFPLFVSPFYFPLAIIRKSAYEVIMKKMVTENELRDILQKACEKAGSQKAWAGANDVSAGYVNDILQAKRGFGKSVLKALGYKELKQYVFVEEKRN